KYEYALRGFAAELTEQQLDNLKKSPIVKFVEKNSRFKAFSYNSFLLNVLPRPKHNGYLFFSTQKIPWSVSRANGPINGIGKKAWIIGTGIDLNHPDLNVDVTDAASYIAGENANDLHGHGTYVAGILAAKNNSSGIVGVAAGATVVPVK